MSSPSPVPNGLKCKEITPWTKLGFSVIGAVVFVIVSLPVVYELVDKMVGLVASRGYIADPLSNAPTHLGIFIHAIVFTLIIWLTMEPWKKEKSYSCEQ
jgi:hypothetical protein